jgi:squalene cyclase
MTEFRHRHNLDGRWDSICLSCYFTTAMTATELELLPSEQQHVCDLVAWKYVRRVKTLLRIDRQMAIKDVNRK